MSVTITQNPGNLNAAYGINAVTLSNNPAGTKYVLRVKQGTQILADIRQPENANGVAIFDIQHVLQNLVETNQIGIESTIAIVDAGPEVAQYTLERGYETPGIALPSIVGTTGPYTVWGAIKPYWQINIDENFYTASSAQGVSLTDKKTVKANTLPAKPSTVNVTDDVYTHSILANGDYTISVYSNGELKTAKVSYFNASNSLISTQQLTTTSTSKFLTIGVGTSKLTIPAGTKYYWVELLDVNGGRGKWKAHYFEILENDCAFTPIQFSWLNKAGFRDYYTFTKKNVKTVNITRNSYRQNLIDYGATTLTVTQGGRGERIYSQKIEESYEAFTDYLSDADDAFLENLITSPDVRVNLNGVWESAILTTNTYTAKTFRTDKLFQLNLVFKMANNIKSNRG
jgi:hypothetical protein